jgi:DNA-binding MarR family transcriptional regulator
MRALSQTRIEILKALKKRNKTLSELSKELGLSKATLFRHLAILQAEGIVKRIENGNRFVYYKLSQKGREILEILLSAIAALTGSVVAYISAYRLSGVSESFQDLSRAPLPFSSTSPTSSPSSPTSSPASVPASPVPTPTPVPKPAGGFMPDLPRLPEIRHSVDLPSLTASTSPAAAAFLAFLFIFVIVLLSFKLVTLNSRERRAHKN